MNKPHLSREDAEKLVGELHDDVIALLNKKVTTPHQRGDFDAGSLVYIISTALSDVLANVMFSQIPLEVDHDRLTESFLKVFREKAAAILEYRKAHEGKPIVAGGMQSSGSMWD